MQAKQDYMNNIENENSLKIKQYIEKRNEIYSSIEQYISNNKAL